MANGETNQVVEAPQSRPVKPPSPRYRLMMIPALMLHAMVGVLGLFIVAIAWFITDGDVVEDTHPEPTPVEQVGPTMALTWILVIPVILVVGFFWRRGSALIQLSLPLIWLGLSVLALLVAAD